MRNLLKTLANMIAFASKVAYHTVSKIVPVPGYSKNGTRKRTYRSIWEEHYGTDEQKAKAKANPEYEEEPEVKQEVKQEVVQEIKQEAQPSQASQLANSLAGMGSANAEPEEKEENKSGYDQTKKKTMTMSM